LLVSVAFMPVPTVVLGAWLGNPNNQIVAAVFYGAATTLGALVFNLLWWYGAYAAKLTSPALGEVERLAHTIAWGPSPFILAILTAIAFVHPIVAVAGYLAVVLIYVLPVPALLALWKRRYRVASGHRS
jgi:uncharacterized membrane protein